MNECCRVNDQMTYLSLTSAFSTMTPDAASCCDFSDSTNVKCIKFVGVLARDVYADKVCLLNLHVLIVCVCVQLGAFVCCSLIRLRLCR